MNKETLESSSFHNELRMLINKHCCENESNTPDWVLAEYLERCLTAFNACMNMRERYYGREFGTQPSIKPALEGLLPAHISLRMNCGGTCAERRVNP